MLIPLSGLFEAHLTVANLDRSVAFYRDRLGLELATRLDNRRCAFFWIGSQRQSMIGLWEFGSGPQAMQLHIAFRVNVDDLLKACDRLKAVGLAPLDLAGEPADEPIVLGWMPAAAVYFRDPDGHLLEFLAMLPEEPRAELGVLTWTDWCHR